MDCEKPKYSVDSEVVLYSGGRWLKLLITVIATFAIVGFVFGETEHPYHNFLTIFVLFVTLLGLIAWTWLEFHTYMIMRPDGLLWVRGKVFLPIEWNNISMFDYRLSRTKRQPRYAIGLRLYDAVAPKTDNALSNLLFGSPTDFIPIGDYVHIPVKFLAPQQVNLEKFQQTYEGMKLSQYVPNLFQIEEM